MWGKKEEYLFNTIPKGLNHYYKIPKIHEPLEKKIQNKMKIN